MRIDVATAHDHAGTARVVREAFGPEEGPTIAAMVEQIRSSDLARPEFELVARAEDGQVLGHVMLSGCRLDTEPCDIGPDQERGPHPASQTVLMLSPLSVSPEVRKSGIGSRLVESAISRADACGEPLVALAGDPAYYGRFGFVPGSRHGIRVPVPTWAPEESGQVRPLSSFASHVPELRGTITWPEAVPED